MWLRVLKNGGRIAYHGRPLVRSRRRPDSLSVDRIWTCKQILRVLDNAGRNLVLDTAERTTLEQGRARFYAMLRMAEGKKAFLDGDVKAAISGLAEANEFFGSQKTTLALWLLRIAPGLLRWGYGVRDRLLRAN